MTTSPPSDSLRQSHSFWRTLAVALVLALTGSVTGAPMIPGGPLGAGHALADGSPVAISGFNGGFYHNPSDSGAFDSSVLAAGPVFSQSFPLVNFNPTSRALTTCSNYVGVTEDVRPFTDVVPASDGTCSTLVAQGNNLQAGLATLDSFQAVFTASITVPAAGQVAFRIHSDDGWILSAGQQSGGTATPSYLYGALTNAPATSPLNHYPVVGALNGPNSPIISTAIVGFPAAGTYPLELDYTECCGGTLSLTMAATFRSPTAPLDGPVSQLDSNGTGSPSEPNVGGTQPCSADPVNCATGNLTESFTDFSIPGRGFPLRFTRTYNSLAAGTDGPFGYGWVFNQGMTLSQDAGSGAATVHEEGGSQVVFTLSNGVYTAPHRVVATLVKQQDGTFTFVRESRTTFTFSSAGKLTAEHDLNGYTTTFSYDIDGNLSTITDQAGRTLTLGYSSGHVVSITDPAGRHVQFDYGDGNGNLTAVTDVNGGVTHFAYDANHLLTTVTNPRGHTTDNAYDGIGRVTSQTVDAAGLGRITTFTYDGDNLSAAGGLTTITDPSGNVTAQQFQYGERIALYRGYLSEDGSTTDYTYDPATLGVTSITDSYGRVSRATYDANGNRLTSTDPLGHVTRHTYDALNHLTSTTDPLGLITTYAYDAHGNLQTVTRNASSGPTAARVTALAMHRTGSHLDFTWRLADSAHVVGFALYAGSHRLNHQLIAVHRGPLYGYRAHWTGSGPFSLHILLADGRSVVVRIQRSSLLHTLFTSAPSAVTTYQHADVAHPGDITAMIDPLGHTWTYNYDTYGDRLSATDPLGNQATATYNTIGWLLTQVSPNGHVVPNSPSAFTTTYDHNAFGDVTTTTDPLGHQTVRAYDANRNLASLTDAKGNTTTYIYDAADERTATDRAGGTVLKTDYNPDGTVADQVDGAGKLTTYSYDAQGRVSSVTDPLGRPTSYSYDLNSNLFSLTTPSGGTISYTYDAANQRKSISYSDASPSVTNLTYDADGQRTGMTDATGNSSWTYDALDRLVSATNGANGTVGYAYDLDGHITTLTYTNGSQVQRSYDAAGRLTSTTDWLSHNFTFGYDANSNFTSQTVVGATGSLDHFAYDAANNLTAISDTANAGGTLATFTYNRDANNRLVSQTATGVSQPAETYSYSALNQLGAVNGSPYSYDPADNLTALVPVATQTYDVANEVTKQTQGATSTTYGYDQSGNRISAAPSTGTTVNATYDLSNRLTAYGSTATYAYNGDGLRTLKTVNGVDQQFSWDLAEGTPLLLSDGATSYLYGPGGLPLEQIDGSQNALFYHHDQLGSTRLLTNTGGSVVATYTYDAYGNIANTTGTASNPFGYAGQYRDEESGFIYLRSRYYDPATGQFISRDPAAFVTRQPYAYAANDPLNRTDPSGLDSACTMGSATINPNNDTTVTGPSVIPITMGNATINPNNYTTVTGPNVIPITMGSATINPNNYTTVTGPTVIPVTMGSATINPNNYTTVTGPTVIPITNGSATINPNNYTTVTGPSTPSLPLSGGDSGGYVG